MINVHLADHYLTRTNIIRYNENMRIVFFLDKLSTSFNQKATLNKQESVYKNA